MFAKPTSKNQLTAAPRPGLPVSCRDPDGDVFIHLALAGLPKQERQ
jgi:hypothetical protein